MTKQEMNRKLELYEGIGVEAQYKNGNVVYYFYEDFADSNGFDRAMETFNTNPFIVRVVYYPKA